LFVTQDDYYRLLARDLELGARSEQLRLGE
jgi:hypothetical protein